MDESVKKYLDSIEHAVRKIIQSGFKLLHKELDADTSDSLLQFIKFGMVGATNVLVSYILYIVFLMAFRYVGIFKYIDYIVAQSISFVVSVLWSFYWNNKIVFTVQKGKKRSTWKALLKTYISYSLTGLLINNVLLIVWIQMLSISAFIAPLLNLFISVPLNFLINKYWAFSD